MRVTATHLTAEEDAKWTAEFRINNPDGPYANTRARIGDLATYTNGRLSKWYPISTAPKDGMAFLGVNTVFIGVMHWDDKRQLFLCDDYRDGWPEYWMPLPAHPIWGARYTAPTDKEE